MSQHADTGNAEANLKTLPGDDVRQIMWRFADRFDLQMLVQSAREVARGPVARLVAEGQRNTHEWTEEKNALLAAYDQAGITTAFMEPEQGGFIAGPKNLALALIAFELAWVDGGAATGSLAGNLGLSPIHEKGTDEQKNHYMSLAVPVQPGEERETLRPAFCLTEPLPYVGVDTGVLSGKVKIKEWREGEEPVLHVEKRGRFITNMGFANVVTAAVDSDDPRIKGSCMVILEETDPGVWDRGAPTKKMVHQLSSTSDPVFSLTIPANRIIGGYTVEDGVIVPAFNHSQIIESVFRRTRVTVGLMSSAKLLSAVEPIIRYQRGRFRGGSSGAPGSPRFDLGLQQKEDSIQRLVDVWATGEASASLGFAAARVFDEFDPLEAQKDSILAAAGVEGPRAALRYFKSKQEEAMAFLRLTRQPAGERDEARLEDLRSDVIVQYMLGEAVANVVCPACKLWNTGHGVNVMREAVSLMGGYGITEDCPGFLGQKWMDGQLEATYEGPEAVQRRQLSVTMTHDLFLTQFEGWIAELREIAKTHPQTGACALSNAMELWQWVLNHLLGAKDADGKRLYAGARQGVTFPMADALCWLLAAYYQIQDVLELEVKGAENPALADGLPGFLSFFQDLCHVQSAAAAGEVGRVCTELVFGYTAQPLWSDSCSQCCTGGQATAEGRPCLAEDGLQDYLALRTRMDSCLCGTRMAKDRAAAALAQVMIPEALDYPR